MGLEHFLNGFSYGRAQCKEGEGCSFEELCIAQVFWDATEELQIFKEVFEFFLNKNLFIPFYVNRDELSVFKDKNDPTEWWIGWYFGIKSFQFLPLSQKTMDKLKTHAQPFWKLF